MLIKYAKSIPRDGGFPQQTRIICFFSYLHAHFQGLPRNEAEAPTEPFIKKMPCITL